MRKTIISALSVLLLVLTSLFIWKMMVPNSRAESLGMSKDDYKNGKKRASFVEKKIKKTLEKQLGLQDLSYGAPVFIRIFKEERELELWVREEAKQTYAHFRTYPIAAMSGKLGPKLKEGDRQAPEGFYFVPPEMMNPQSRFHLAFNIGYPNSYDRAHGRTGSFIMVHGSDVSIGCFAMTDEKIEEIYTLCAAAHQNGQNFFRVHCFPYRMTPERHAQSAKDQWYQYWDNLKTGYDWFEEKRIPPNVSVQEKRYVFGQ